MIKSWWTCTFHHEVDLEHCLVVFSCAAQAVLSFACHVILVQLGAHQCFAHRQPSFCQALKVIFQVVFLAAAAASVALCSAPVAWLFGGLSYSFADLFQPFADPSRLFAGGAPSSN